MDVDPEMGKVYYLHYTTGSTIRRCDLNGANIEVVYSGTAASFDIDRVNRKLYLSLTDDDDPNQIMRANLDGTGVEVVISGLSTGSTDVAVDSLGGKVYWVQHIDGQPASSGSIHRVNFDGTAHEQIAVPGQVPFAIAVHHASGKVFWSNFGFSPTLPGGVFRANLDFSNVEQIVSGISGLTGLDIDEAAGKLYFCRQQSVGMFHCDLNGGGLVALGFGAYDVACVSEEFGFVCPGDSNQDLLVNIDDLVNVITSWGPCRSCSADLNGDGTVNIDDLIFVITHWTI